jgi:hypothetical protein
MKWLPRTVTSRWFGQPRQNSRWAPTRIEPPRLGEGLAVALHLLGGDGPQHARGRSAWKIFRAASVLAARNPARAAHAHEVGRQAASAALHVRDDVAPQVRRRVAVQEDDRVADADLDVGHLAVQHRKPAPLVRCNFHNIFQGKTLPSHPRVWQNRADP